jgi:hypothetical protein
MEEAIDQCVEGITGNADLKNRVIFSKRNLMFHEGQYFAAAQVGGLFKMPAVNATISKDPVIVDTLKKSELNKLYDDYFVPKIKPARLIYDSLMNSALEKCPFCGGIGTPRNLDHFLPKHSFPQFSIAPRNLIPSCLDCNLGEKATKFAKMDCDQIIQPYADSKVFFENQWIFASYRETADDSPGFFEYFVEPPKEWNDVDKVRARTHFKEFGLAKRYAIKAAEGLGANLSQIRNFKRMGLDKAAICQALLLPGVTEAPFINHWQKGKFQALIEYVQRIP